MSGVTNSYETAGKADYVVPPPFEQLPRCQPAVGGGASKACKEGLPGDKGSWSTNAGDSFRSYTFKGATQTTYL